MVAIGYSAILLLFTIEGGLRPVLIDINRTVSPRLRRDVPGLPLRFKLMAALPMINIITGLTVAALTSGGGGGASLGLDVLAATTVAFTISFELTVLLSKSILRPVHDLQRATQRVAEGHYDAHVPVTTTDELGDLSAAFNQMIEGLAERERIREAFGTYLDQEIAEYILSEGYSPEGVEVEVTLLFCDVRDFTGFAAKASPTEVVANLNALFEQAVPFVARHGGHVEKFIGDGLVAVFGAPEQFPNHADRAVRAAIEMAQEINGDMDGDSPHTTFQIGVGVNSGKVVAGSIGGGGRLNFSVIGDAVNMASRVEAATRDFEHDVLITAATREKLSETLEVVECGPQRLKGYDEPVELFAPLGAPVTKPMGAGAAETIGDGNAPKPSQPIHTLPKPR
jgi:class 3 adenylate cyclase